MQENNGGKAEGPPEMNSPSTADHIAHLTAQCLPVLDMLGSPQGIVSAMFFAGLVSGFTHCAGMCGPFVLAQTDSATGPGLARIMGAALLPYHLGRMTTYIALAALFHSVLNLALLFAPMRGLLAVPLLLTAAVIFISSAFPAFAPIFPWAARLSAGLPLGWLYRLSRHLDPHSGTSQRFALGVILGFMPCGMVVAALMATSLVPSLLHAIFAMGAFALGTMPALILVGLGGQALRWRHPQTFAATQRGMMILSSLWLLAAASWFIFGSI